MRSSFLAQNHLFRQRLWLVGACASLALVACGGGGSSATDASAGAGLGVGTVTGFGSIIVDGVHYDDKTVNVKIDTVANAPDVPASGVAVGVKLGQHVEVAFTGDETNSTATSVSVSAELIGPVTALLPNVIVVGRQIKTNVDPAAGPVTVFEGYTAATDIKVGDRIEVHGQALTDGSVQATRIERRPVAEAWLRLAGDVSALAVDGSFKLGAETVTVDTSTQIFPAGAALANGQHVAVWSTGAAVNSTVTAKFIRIKKAPAATATDARLAGAITDCTPTCDASFKVAATAVNASAAEFVNGSKTDLANGKWIELRGTLDLTSGAITATRVTFHKADPAVLPVSLKGAITDFIDASHFKVRDTPVTTDGTTVMNPSCIAPLAQGTLVTVTGSVGGFAVLARTIDCFTSTEGVSVEGKGSVHAVDAVARTFTLDGDLFAHVTLSYGDATTFQTGHTAADLKPGVLVEITGSVASGVLTVKQIGFADILPTPAPAGVVVLETEGIASHVTTTGNAISSFVIDGTTFAITTASSVRTLDGALVDGARIHVLFTKVAGVNVVLLVNTKH